jgi:hypothetical protein
MGKNSLVPLEDFLNRRPLLEVRACVSLVSALLDALSGLHERGEIQHSMDPRAVLVVERRGGAIFKIHELGLRHLPDPSMPPRTLIRDGQVLVNLRYISPEYIRQRPLDARHDLFAVGIVLHQLLTGAHPFEADSDLARMMAITSGLPEELAFPPGRDSSGLVAFLRRLLAGDPADRPASAAEARAELLRAMEDASSVAGSPSPAAQRTAAAPAPRPSPPALSGVLAIARRESIEAGSFGLSEVNKETVSVFMERIFDGGKSGKKETGEPGHVVLPSPVVHPFAMGHADSPLSLLLDVPDETLWEIQLARKWIIVRAERNMPVRAGQVITEEQIFTEQLDAYGEDVDYRSGSDALLHLLSSLDLAAEMRAGFEHARSAMASAESSGADGEQSRPVKRLLLLERYLRNGVEPASLMLHVLPIVPRALRQRGTPAYDLDELYRGVLRVSTRLSLMHKVAAPVMVERNQREIVTRNIEGLFANGRGGRLFTAWEKRGRGSDEDQRLFCLSDLLRSLSIDVSKVFEGYRVRIEATEEVAAALRGVGLQVVNG